MYSMVDVAHTPDVPDQYKLTLDAAIIKLIKQADIIHALVKDLGCTSWNGHTTDGLQIQIWHQEDGEPPQ